MNSVASRASNIRHEHTVAALHLSAERGHPLKLVTGAREIYHTRDIVVRVSYAKLPECQWQGSIAFLA